MGSTQSVELICHVHVRTAQGRELIKVQGKWRRRKSEMKRTCYRKLKELFRGILERFGSSIDISENVLRMFGNVAKDYNSCDCQVIIIELLLHPPTNTVAVLLIEKMNLSGLDDSTVDKLMSMELNKIERQCSDIVSFFRQV